MPNMKKHVRFHLGYKATCKECNETFSNVGSLRKHTRTVHPEVYLARLVERLKKHGEIRGPDKNFLKQEAAERCLSGKTSSSLKENKKNDINQVSETVISEVSNSESVSGSKESEEGILDNELGFANDEIDEGEGRFKFSCTVCKKRFSSYLNMCRHRRKAHNNENKPLTFGIHPKPPSPVVENPEEIAAFYANVSHNIAINLYNYIDGTPESLSKFEQHINIEDYKGSFQTAESEPNRLTESSNSLDKYNFPSDFKPDQTQCHSVSENVCDNESQNVCVESSCRSVADKKQVKETEKKQERNLEESVSDSDDEVGRLFIATEDHIEEKKKKTRNQAELKSSANLQNIGFCASKVQPAQLVIPEAILKQNTTVGGKKLPLLLPKLPSGTTTLPTMGIASYGMKLLSNLVLAKRVPDSGDMDKQTAPAFFNIQIANGALVAKNSPSARTFHQVMKL